MPAVGVDLQPIRMLRRNVLVPSNCRPMHLAVTYGWGLLGRPGPARFLGDQSGASRVDRKLSRYSVVARLRCFEPRNATVRCGIATHHPHLQ